MLTWQSPWWFLGVALAVLLYIFSRIEKSDTQRWPALTLVHPALDRMRLSSVIIRSGFISDKLVQRAETTLYLDVYDDGTLQWLHPVPRASGMQLRAFAPALRSGQIGGQSYRETRFAWGAMPLRPGPTVATFGLLSATHFGERVAFRAPAAIGQADSVPTYLPLHLHVGRLDFVRATMPRQLRVGRPEFWVTQVIGRGLSVAGLLKSISFPASSEKIFFYKPTLTLEPSQNDVQIIEIKQPFKALRGGDVKMPALHIPFYDPTVNNIATLVVAGPSASVTNPSTQRMVRAILVGTGLLVFSALMWLFRRRIRQHIMHWQVSRCLRRAKTPEDLLRLAYAHKPLATELRQAEMFTRIEAIVYGRAGAADFHALRRDVLRVFKQSRRPACRRELSVVERVLTPIG